MFWEEYYPGLDALLSERLHNLTATLDMLEKAVQPLTAIVPQLASAVPQLLGNMENIQTQLTDIPHVVEQQLDTVKKSLNSTLDGVTSMTAAQLTTLTSALGQAQEKISDSVQEKLSNLSGELGLSLLQSNNQTFLELLSMRNRLDILPSTESLEQIVQGISALDQAHIAEQMNNLQKTLQANLTDVANTIGQIQQLIPATVATNLAAQLTDLQSSISQSLNSSTALNLAQFTELQHNVGNVSNAIALVQGALPDTVAQSMELFKDQIGGTIELINSNISAIQVFELTQNLSSVVHSIQSAQEAVETSIADKLIMLQNVLNDSLHLGLINTIEQIQNSVAAQLYASLQFLQNISSIVSMIPTQLQNQADAALAQLSSLQTHSELAAGQIISLQSNVSNLVQAQIETAHNLNQSLYTALAQSNILTAQEIESLHNVTLLTNSLISERITNISVALSNITATIQGLPDTTAAIVTPLLTAAQDHLTAIIAHNDNTTLQQITDFQHSLANISQAIGLTQPEVPAIFNATQAAINSMITDLSQQILTNTTSQLIAMNATLQNTFKNLIGQIDGISNTVSQGASLTAQQITGLQSNLSSTIVSMQSIIPFTVATQINASIAQAAINSALQLNAVNASIMNANIANANQIALLNGTVLQSRALNTAQLTALQSNISSVQAQLLAVQNILSGLRLLKRENPGN